MKFQDWLSNDIGVFDDSHTDHTFRMQRERLVLLQYALLEAIVGYLTGQHGWEMIWRYIASICCPKIQA